MTKRALLIGVSHYQTGLDPLPAAVRDMAAMERVLKDPELGGFDGVETLENPGTQALREAIETFFHNANRDDLITLFFSGHGVKDDKGALFFATPDTKKNAKGILFRSTAVEASFVQTVMNDCRAKRQVVILDCCFSGAFDPALQTKDDGSIDLETQLLGSEGRVVLASSSSTQYSLQITDSELSLYTRYLVEGIETGAGDKNSDGLVSILELHEYAAAKVQETAPSMTPKMITLKDEGFNIVLSRAKQGDPRLQYRKEVSLYTASGEIAPLYRSILDLLRGQLGLGEGEAEEIEAEVLRPYRERLENIEKYKAALIAQAEREFPFSETTQKGMQRLQGLLGLRDEDVVTVQQQLELTQQLKKAEPTPNRSQEGNLITVSPSQEGNRVGQVRSLDLGNGVSLPLVYIPAGTFWMGQTAAETQQLKKEVGEKDYKQYFAWELPRHRVTVPPFWMARTPITQAQWSAVMGNNPATGYDKKFVSPHQPVVGVSWDRAVEFCEPLTKLFKDDIFRLPTEAEWEYACRAGTETAFYFGDSITTDQANFDGNFTYNGSPKGQYRAVTTPVGQFPANAWGLQDMHGNVWEWCADQWYDSYEQKPQDLKDNGSIAWTKENTSISPSIDTARLLRGGSWDNAPGNCRAAQRVRSNHDIADNLVGVRVVCVARTS